MPFITPIRREIISKLGLLGLRNQMGVVEIEAGDRCYVFYKDMVTRWKANPRWTTAHNIFKEMLNDEALEFDDTGVARWLAWQVFFIKYVMPYETQKMMENGDI